MKCYDSLARAVGRNYALKRSEKFEPTTEGGSVVSRHRISKPARSGSSSALHVIFASGVAPPSARFAGVAGARASWRNASALACATLPATFYIQALHLIAVFHTIFHPRRLML